MAGELVSLNITIDIVGEEVLGAELTDAGIRGDAWGIRNVIEVRGGGSRYGVDIEVI